MSPISRALSTPAALMLLGSCEAEEIPASNAPPPPPTTATVELRIGTLSGAEPYIFGRISGVALDETGRILIADDQADEIRVFSPEGEHLYTFGGSGAGPGELSAPCCIAFGPEGDLWVRDGGNARYNRYSLTDSAVNYVDLTRMSHSDVNFFAPTTFDRKGRLIDIGHSNDPATGAMRMIRFHVDSFGAVANQDIVHTPPDDSVGVYKVRSETENGHVTRYLYQPYGPTQLIAHAPGGGWAEGISSRYRIAWHHPDGSTQTIARPAVTSGPELSADERASAEERMDFYIEQFGVARFPFDVPENKTPLHALHFDQLGRLWVELSVPDNQPREADVFDAEGTHVATVRWPDNVSLRAIYPARNVALGIAVDSMGVQRAVRLRLPQADTGLALAF
ncbi:MAG TPA: hypothetical protein VFI91_00895 [Longimicrobiaceae bacterium]|nr:hypothetical protein [Longimicrobiaceae bacterium]